LRQEGLFFMSKSLSSTAGWIIWFTGLSGAGKTTVARGLHKQFDKTGKSVIILDGDQIRAKRFPELGFSKSDIQKNNELIVGQGHDQSGLYQKCLTASKIHWISGETPEKENLKAKIRYRAKDAPCQITNLNSTEISVEFEEPRFAIAPGQSIVFYFGDVCLGGAVIDKAFN